ALSIGRAAEAKIQISERRAGLGTIGIEALGRHELSRSPPEAVAIGRWLSLLWHGGEQFDGLEAHAANGICKKRCDQCPDLLGRYICQHIERADPNHRIRIGETTFCEMKIRGRQTRCQFIQRTCPRKSWRIWIPSNSREQILGGWKILPGSMKGLS